MTNTFSEKAEAFRNHKSALSSTLKLEANLPVDILKVVSFDEAITENEQDRSKYAQITFKVEVDTSEGVQVKDWNVTSAGLVDILELNKIAVGSSFTVVKKGEGYHTKYLITNVKNLE